MIDNRPVTDAEARSIAARTGMPGCLGYPRSRPAPRTKLAANGIDEILDRSAE